MSIIHSWPRFVDDKARCGGFAVKFPAKKRRRTQARRRSGLYMMPSISRTVRTKNTHRTSRMMGRAMAAPFLVKQREPR